MVQKCALCPKVQNSGPTNEKMEMQELNFFLIMRISWNRRTLGIFNNPRSNICIASFNWWRPWKHFPFRQSTFWKHTSFVLSLGTIVESISLIVWVFSRFEDSGLRLSSTSRLVWNKQQFRFSEIIRPNFAFRKKWRFTLVLKTLGCCSKLSKS